MKRSGTNALLDLYLETDLEDKMTATSFLTEVGYDTETAVKEILQYLKRKQREALFSAGEKKKEAFKKNMSEFFTFRNEKTFIGTESLQLLYSKKGESHPVTGKQEIDDVQLFNFLEQKKNKKKKNKK